VEAAAVKTAVWQHRVLFKKLSQLFKRMLPHHGVKADRINGCQPFKFSKASL
jgi:hypothetical protein